MELLDSTEKLVEAHNQNDKLQEQLDKMVKEKVLYHMVLTVHI